VETGQALRHGDDLPLALACLPRPEDGQQVRRDPADVGVGEALLQVADADLTARADEIRQPSGRPGRMERQQRHDEPLPLTGGCAREIGSVERITEDLPQAVEVLGTPDARRQVGQPGEHGAADRVLFVASGARDVQQVGQAVALEARAEGERRQRRAAHFGVGVPDERIERGTRFVPGQEGSVVQALRRARHEHREREMAAALALAQVAGEQRDQIGCQAVLPVAPAAPARVIERGALCRREAAEPEGRRCQGVAVALGQRDQPVRAEPLGHAVEGELRPIHRAEDSIGDRDGPALGEPLQLQVCGRGIPGESVHQREGAFGARLREDGERGVRVPEEARIGGRGGFRPPLKCVCGEVGMEAGEAAPVALVGALQCLFQVPADPLGRAEGEQSAQPLAAPADEGGEKGIDRRVSPSPVQPAQQDASLWEGCAFQRGLDLRIVADQREQQEGETADGPRRIGKRPQRVGAVAAPEAGLEREPPLIESALLQGRHDSGHAGISRGQTAHLHHSAHPRVVGQRLQLTQQCVGLHASSAFVSTAFTQAASASVRGGSTAPR
jgi:hypothetical protein